MKPPEKNQGVSAFFNVFSIGAVILENVIYTLYFSMVFSKSRGDAIF